MWIDSNFMEKVADALDAFAIGKDISIDKLFGEFEQNSKYKSIINRLDDITNTISDQNNIILKNKKSLDELNKQSSIMAQAAIDGELDIQIDTINLDDDIIPIANNINSFVFQVRDAFLDVNDKLDRLSAGDFKAQITKEYKGAFNVSKNATNNLGKYLNFLIEDSNTMNEAAKVGELDVRIDSSKYQGDFQLIANGVNDTMETTVGNMRLIGENLDKLSNGDFQANVTQEMDGDYTVLKEATNNLGKYLNFLIEDSNTMNEAAKIGELDVRIDSSKYQGDFQLIASGVNNTMETTVGNMRLIGENLDKLSNGDFQANVTQDMEGDYTVLKEATNSLGKYLNFLIEDSSTMNEAVRNGELDVRIDANKYQGDFQTITQSLNDTMDTNEKDRWVKDGGTNLSRDILSKDTLQEQVQTAISTVSRYVEAGAGGLYLYDNESKLLKLKSSFAYIDRDELSNSYELGTGVVGQVGLEKQPILLKNIRKSDRTISTGTTNEAPLNTYTYPILYRDELLGVIEVASYEIFDEVKKQYFEDALTTLGATLYASIQAEATVSLLKETQIAQKEAVEAKDIADEATQKALDTQREIEKANAELEEQQQQLEEQNSEMAEQQQQLEEANAQMEEQQQQLKEQNYILAQSKEEVEKSQEELEEKAKDLETSSKYKSEFLANMSHELRTPLNSVILLSETLKANKENRLSEKDIKRATMINRSGEELLRLINDILDLSKVEAGKMELIIDTFSSNDFADDFKMLFEESAQSKGLTLNVIDNYQGIIINDRDRLSQVTRNFISNALKFTANGSITIQLDKTNKNDLKVSVIDTGIGIPKDKQKIVFEAFQQVDGGTSREYGGTGLGLSISRELAKLMHGSLNLESETGKGSTFSISLPNLEDQSPAPIVSSKPIVSIVNNAPSIKVDDDRKNIKLNEKAFLIIEDDVTFVDILKDKIKESGHKVLVATTGKDGLALASKYKLKGVMLDLGLPDINGIDVLKEFKTNITLKSIPIYIISGEDKERIVKKEGAIGFAHKPVNNNDLTNILDKFNKFEQKNIKDLLIVEDNDIQRETLIDFIGNDTIKSTGVSNVQNAIVELKKGIYDAVIIDLTLGDGSGYEVCEYIKKNNLDVPIIIYTGKDLTKDEENKLRSYTDSIIVKSVASKDRLLSDVDMFLHRATNNIKLKTHITKELDLSTKKILAVDDDIRNLYVLTDILDDTKADIITASNGQEAIDILKKRDDIDIVLMDIMMPVKNGLEATQEIRGFNKDIPIIALTAKAMTEDKKDALDAGCNDYLTKPIKTDHLFETIRCWLQK